MATRSVRRQKRYTGFVHYGKNPKKPSRTSQDENIALIDKNHLFNAMPELDNDWQKSQQERERIFNEYMFFLKKTSPTAFRADSKTYYKNGRFDEQSANRFYKERLSMPLYKRSTTGDFSKEQKAMRSLLFYKSDLDPEYIVGGLPPVLQKAYKKTFVKGDTRGKIDTPDETAYEAKHLNIRGRLNDTQYRFLKDFAKDQGRPTENKDMARDILDDPEFYARGLRSKAGLNKNERNRVKTIISVISPGSDISDKGFDEAQSRAESSYHVKLDEKLGQHIAKEMHLKTPGNWKTNYTIKAIVAKIQPRIENQEFKLEDWKKALAAQSEGGEASLSYSEVTQYADGRPVTKKKVERWTEPRGISLLGFPLHEDKEKKEKNYLSGKKSKGSGGGSGRSGGGGGGFSYGGGSSWLSKGGTVSKDRAFFSKTADVEISGGKPVFKEQKSRMSEWMAKRKKGLRGPTSAERYREFKSKYGGIIPEEQYRGAMERGNFFDRLRVKRMARKMAVDPTYMQNQHKKWILEEGIAKAKLLRARRESQQQVRAASSTWYSAWFRFSKYTKWIAAAALLVAILFLPMGLFYVLGWALAVGVIALFQFIIWVFMEFWFLVAQALVSVVGLVGQIFVMAINWVGKTSADLLGQTYKPFDYQLVQNMLMFERDSAGVYHVFYYNNAVTGKSEILTWGALNLTPPSFLSLELFKPTWFDTSTIFGHIVPPAAAFFNWLYGPIALRYTAWMSDSATEWYWPGIIIGVPVILIIVAIFLIYRFFKRRVYA
jgi:hypothetical protein